MSLVRWLMLGFLVGALSSLGSSCGGGPCGPSTCFGCCSASGECVGGLEVAACGTKGGTCSACAEAEVCQVGACMKLYVAGGADAGADSGTTFAVADNPLGFTADITPNPPVLGTNSLKVILRGANGILVPGAAVTAKTFMPAMGHGSPTPSVSEVGNGEYKVSGVKFTMGGGWTVTLKASAPGGLSGEQVFTYDVY